MHFLSVAIVARLNNEKINNKHKYTPVVSKMTVTYIIYIITPT